MEHPLFRSRIRQEVASLGPTSRALPDRSAADDQFKKPLHDSSRVAAAGRDKPAELNQIYSAFTSFDLCHPAMGNFQA
jgi:hypothetical protein